MVIVANNLVVDGVVARILRSGQIFAVCAVVQLIVQCAARGGACGDERLIAAFIDQIGDGGRRGGNGGSLLQRDADGDGVGAGVGVVLRLIVAVQIDRVDRNGDFHSADVILRGQRTAAQSRVRVALADREADVAVLPHVGHKLAQVKRLAAARDARRRGDGGFLLSRDDISGHSRLGERVVACLAASQREVLR